MRNNYFYDLPLAFDTRAALDNDADLVISAGGIALCDQGVTGLKKFRQTGAFFSGTRGRNEVGTRRRARLKNPTYCMV